MSKHRNYDWLGLIQYNNDQHEFLKYIRKHKAISLNRNARAFCQKKKYVLWSIFDPDFVRRLQEGV